MISRSRRIQIQKLARSKLVEHNRLALPVKPKSFAESLGITVVPLAFPKPDISGCLMVDGRSFAIGYSTAIRNQGFQNFTVAHELGHYFIDDHPAALLGQGNHFSRSGFISTDRFEKEADLFASELLMPWALVEPLVRAKSPGFQSIKTISERCESSLVASAIRFCQDTNDCVAAVVSYQGTIEFMTASQSFKEIPGLDWLQRGNRLPVGVPSSTFSARTDWIDDCEIVEEGSRLHQWFPNAPDIEVEEDVVGLGSYGRLLSILVVEWNAVDQEEEEASSDNYIERWEKGIFRPRK